MVTTKTHDLSWENGDLPVSALFNDTFFSRHNGRAEAAYVFLDGNRLPDRWLAPERFSIGELGFGTGLNFLETWRQWIATRRPVQALVFTSFERYPVSVPDMARALRPWPALSPLAERLGSCWSDQDATGGRWQMDDQTILQVIAGDARQTVARWDSMADAWYLDGFSPAKNPAMWRAALMADVFAHTNSGGSFATYSAAGWVGRNLRQVGFEVVKRPGHGGKRQMMRGHKPGPRSGKQV